MLLLYHHMMILMFAYLLSSSHIVVYKITYKITHLLLAYLYLIKDHMQKIVILTLI